MRRSPIAISLCMIVKNEVEVLSRCLDTIRDVVEEIIIVDTGSTDATKKVAQQYTAKIYDFEWIDDFSAARNFAFSKATKEYILWLDADDIIAKEDTTKLLQLKCTMNDGIDAVSMKYYLSFDAHGKPTYQIRRYRLVKRDRNFQWYGAVHEYLAVHGNLMNSDIGVIHKKEKEYTDRNLKIYEKLIDDGKKLSPRDIYYYANECKDHGKYDMAITWYQKFLNGEQGWLEDNIQACLKKAECHLKIGEWEEAVNSCLQSFMYDKPRGEVRCYLGHLFFKRNEYHKAIDWYHAAIAGPAPTDSPFFQEACYTWLPHIQLCICYDHIGEYEKAIYHLEQAACYIPKDPIIQHNRDYFKNLFKNS